MGRIKEGDSAIQFEVVDYLGNGISLDSFRGKKVLLSFFRDASCPFCNLRLNELIRKHNIFQENKIELICFFSSKRNDILKYAGKQEAPFPIIPDPNLTIYKIYRVEESFRAKLNTMVKFNKIANAVNSEYFNLESFTTKNIVPADFLISEDFTIKKAYYGKNFSDHLPLSKVFNWNN